MIRAYHISDIFAVEDIHKKYYEDEFPLPNFLDKYLCAFTVVNNGEVVSVGGVRTILEAVILTDKSKSTKLKREALYQMLQASVYTAGRSGYQEICATVIKDPKWERHLKRVGFKPVVGNMLVLPL